MSVQSVADLKSLITAHARVSHKVGEQGSETPTLVESCKAFLKQSAQEFLIEHASAPILQQFSLDTTPTHYREYVGAAHNPKLSSRMSAPVRATLLVQFTSFSRLRLDNTVENALVFRDPVAVTGKKTGAQLAAIAASCPNIFSDVADPNVLRLKHCVMDRGVPSGIAHYLSGRWQQDSETSGASTSAGSPAAASARISKGADSMLLHWHTQVGCICHDLHNSLKWSMAADFEDVEMLKKIYTVCVASRALYMPVYSGLPSALTELIEPIDTALCPDPSQLRLLWESLQLSEDLVNELVHFRVLCRAGVLNVDAGCPARDR